MLWKGSFLLPLAVAFLLGISLGNLFEFFPFTLLFLSFSCLFFHIIFRLFPLSENLRKGSRRIPFERLRIIPRRSTLLFLAVLILGGFHFHWDVRKMEAVSSHLPSEREKVHLQGWISSPVRQMENRLTFLLQGEYFRGRNGNIEFPGKVKVSVYDSEVDLRYGDRIEVMTRLKKPRGFVNPGGFDYGLYQKRHGVVATASVQKAQDVKKVGVTGNPFFRAMAVQREKLRQAALLTLEGSDAGIFLAMILGERGGLTQEIRDRFMASGTTHILSISGSHLGFVALVSFFLFRRLLLFLPSWLIQRMGVYFIPTQGAAFLTIFPVSFYSFLAGGEVATIRALLMILLGMFALMIQRTHRLFNVYGIALLSTLLWDPQALFDISFQLSYLSVLIILLYLDHAQKEAPEEELDGLRSRLIQIGGLAKKGLFLSFLITVGTAPLVLFYFNQFPWVGILSNIIVGPLAGILVVPLGLLSCILSLIMDFSFLPLAQLNHFFLSLFYRMVTLFAFVPGAQVFLPAPGVVLIGLFYLFFFMSIHWRTEWKKMSVGVGSAFGLVAFWLAPLLLFQASQELKITFLDVGQGDGAVIEFPRGEVMVIDGGAARGDFDVGRLVMAPYLWNRGVRHLDYVVVSHPQYDHEGGIPYLLDRFSIGEVWGNGYQRDLPFHRKFEQVIEEKNISYRMVSRGKGITMAKGTSVSLLHPSPVVSVSRIPSNSRMNNNRSVVVQIQHGKHSFLFTGDIEKQAEKELVRSGKPLKSTLIKVPHHGSQGSLDPEFLNQVCPQVAVISVGGRNPYGHPTPQALKAYDSLSSRIYRTDEDGAIMVKSDGQTLRIEKAIDLRFDPIQFGQGFLKNELENWRKVFE